MMDRTIISGLWKRRSTITGGISPKTTQKKIQPLQFLVKQKAAEDRPSEGQIKGQTRSLGCELDWKLDDRP